MILLTTQKILPFRLRVHVSTLLIILCSCAPTPPFVVADCNEKSNLYWHPTFFKGGHDYGLRHNITVSAQEVLDGIKAAERHDCPCFQTTVLEDIFEGVDKQFAKLDAAGNLYLVVAFSDTITKRWALISPNYLSYSNDLNNSDSMEYYELINSCDICLFALPFGQYSDSDFYNHGKWVGNREIWLRLFAYPYAAEHNIPLPMDNVVFHGSMLTSDATPLNWDPRVLDEIMNSFSNSLFKELQNNGELEDLLKQYFTFIINPEANSIKARIVAPNRVLVQSSVGEECVIEFNRKKPFDFYLL